MTILYGFKLDERGRMMDRLFDLDKMPPDWYDSPDKVPGVKKPEVVETLTKIIQSNVVQIAGDHQPLTVADGVTFKRKGGRPKGSKNKVPSV